MIEAKFGLFKAQQKSMLGHALELMQPGFGKALERLDNVNVKSDWDALVLVMTDAEMAVEAEVHQPFIAAPAIGINQRHNTDFILRYVIKGLF